MPRNAPSPSWGLLANPGFERKRLKAVYFFAGDWRFHGLLSDHYPPGLQSDDYPAQWYEFGQNPNYKTYTICPQDNRHLGWSENQNNRDFALTTMLEVGTNVVVMSYWGERGSDRWVGSAPMHTSTFAHDELFNAAVGKGLFIMPAIESSNGMLGCNRPIRHPDGTWDWPVGSSESYNFASDFPHPDHDGTLAPQLIQQIKDLIQRYITEPANSEWPSKWAHMYDRDGNARLAINLIHVGSTKRGLSDEAFAATFDAVAEQVFADTGQLVGFTLDALPYPQTGGQGLMEGDCAGWQRWFPIGQNGLLDPNGQVTALWRNEQHLDLFAVGADGVVRSIWYDQSEPAGYRPQGWFEIGPEKRFAPQASITAVWNGDTHLDLFVTDTDGVVWSIWYDQSAPSGYAPGWLSIHSETRLAPSAPVTALWAPGKGGQHLDLFGTTGEGIVMSIWWDIGEPGGYRSGGWFAIDLTTRTAAGALVVALWKGSNHLDLFMIGIDGTVRSTWFDTSSGYRAGGWFSIAPIPTGFEPGGNLAVMWRNDRHLDFFAIDARGTVWSTWFDTHDGYRSDGWFTIHPELQVQPFAPVSANWRDSDFLDLFVVGPGGRTDAGGQPWWITYDANDPTNHPDGYSKFGWFPIQFNMMKVGREAPMAAPRAGAYVDLFAVASDGTVVSTSNRKVDLVYVPNSAPGGLEQISAILAIQMFIPEVYDSSVTEDDLFNFKRLTLESWQASGVPLLLDLAPGYDGHIVFPGSKMWGNNEGWRLRLTNLWTQYRNAYVGISYDTWNGYTEGYVAVPSDRNQDDDFRWITQLFQLVDEA